MRQVPVLVVALALAACGGPSSSVRQSSAYSEASRALWAPAEEKPPQPGETEPQRKRREQEARVQRNCQRRGQIRARLSTAGAGYPAMLQERMRTEAGLNAMLACMRFYLETGLEPAEPPA